ncbi:MAG: hypothetical protein IKJ88_06095 [Clostridia bacterium]|nr:hypothetical protein [Clostridia bacterium]MBR3975416.1 hypothetical protein [Clostridia bacterium]
MEDNNNYTYTYEKDKEKKSTDRPVKAIFAVVIAALIVLSVVLGILFGMQETDTQETTTELAETTTEEMVETTTLPEELYKAGDYIVATGGYSLRFRKDHAKDAESITDIPDKTQLTVTEIYYDETAEEDFKYWGQVVYLGHTGWVTMSYLENAFSEDIVTPEELPTDESTTAVESTTAAEGTTAASTQQNPTTETTTAASSNTTETTTQATASKYTAGDYKVVTGGYTLTLRQSASATATAILSIPEHSQITVLEVVDTGVANGNNRYWGKIVHLGHTGYVSMAYLQKVN